MDWSDPQIESRSKARAELEQLKQRVVKKAEQSGIPSSDQMFKELVFLSLHELAHDTIVASLIEKEKSAVRSFLSSKNLIGALKKIKSDHPKANPMEIMMMQSFIALTKADYTVDETLMSNLKSLAKQADVYFVTYQRDLLALADLTLTEVKTQLNSRTQ